MGKRKTLIGVDFCVELSPSKMHEKEDVVKAIFTRRWDIYYEDDFYPDEVYQDNIYIFPLRRFEEVKSRVDWVQRSMVRNPDRLRVR